MERRSEPNGLWLESVHPILTKYAPVFEAKGYDDTDFLLDLDEKGLHKALADLPQDHMNRTLAGFKLLKKNNEGRGAKGEEEEGAAESGAAPGTFDVGQQIDGRYHILRKLEHGAMGLVYAKQRIIDRGDSA